MSIKVSIVTINFGHWKKIQSLWDSICQHLEGVEFEFIIVDNASPGDDEGHLKQIFADENRVHLLFLEQNLGFGAGYTEGVKFAKGEYLAIVNPDIYLQENCIQNLIKNLATTPELGIAVPKLKNPDETWQQNARVFPQVWEMLGRRLLQNQNQPTADTLAWYEAKKPVGVDWAQGSFLCLKTRFFTEDLRGFDPRFFLFLEDTDLCRRCWNLGKKVCLIPDAVAIHGAERLSGNDLWSAVSKKTFWIHIVSAVKYFWKHRGQRLPDVK